MAAGSWVVHNRFKEYKGDNTIDMDADSFEVRLAASTSNVGDVETNSALSVTDEISGNGYSAQSVTSTWERSGSIVTFDTSNAAFLAAGGPITARYVYLVDTTVGEVVAHALLNDAPADVSVADGHTLAININGVFQEL